MTRFRRPASNPDYARLEEQVLERWAVDDTFARSVEARRGSEAYIFYDGPPFANGLPHYGHIMTSYIKDTVPRYFTMRGYLVERRWGWDCHGLPIEIDAQQELGLHGVQEINEYGVGPFNEVCRQSVFKYADEWRRIIDRIGRWVDWDDQYRTMDLSYMESVMHIFATLWRQGLIYESYKVLAYCTSCQTPLSNFETRLDDAYRDREDPTVTVLLPLVDEPRTSLLVWTTTPWTLPSNVLAAISPILMYEIWESPDTESRVVLAQASRDAYAGALEGWTLVGTEPGIHWDGMHYEPLFDYFADTPGAFRVIASDVVTEGEGTGIVHIAPAFGEEDAEIGRAQRVDGPMPVRDDGTFSDRVQDLSGLHVLAANARVAEMAADSGRLFASGPYTHPYPHCWRCDSPLIYRAIASWMVSIDKLRDQMQRSNSGVNWIPAHVGPGAMGHGIQSAPDWALTRNRFWGSPVPVWKSDGEPAVGAPVPGGYDRAADGTILFIPASIAELETVSGQDIGDLHRPFIDAVAWDAPDDGTMRRVPDVLDCWFESGSMPFAQNHWPVAQGAQTIDEMDYPADFIVEYIGQVRGWFYTLLVISTALTHRSSFKTCLAHGVLQGNDGRKLSKRLKNYPDPEEVLETYGSDALRTSLLASPIVRGGDGPVSMAAVQDATRTYLAPLMNAFTFFATYAESAGYAAPTSLRDDLSPSHPLDRYALAAVDQLRSNVESCMDTLDLAGAYESLRKFLDELTNWYIRVSRRRFWEPTAPLDAAEAEPFDTLHTVLHRTARLAAPLLPFLSDWLAAELGAEQSVHLDDWPTAHTHWADPQLLAGNSLVRRIVTLARSIRADAKVPNRQPLRRVLVEGADPAVLASFEDVIRSEVNVKDVEIPARAGELTTVRVVPNPRALGPRLGPRVQEVLRAARAGDGVVNDDGTALVAGETLSADEFAIALEPVAEEFGIAADRDLVVALDLAIDDHLRLEGQARVLLRHVQNLRKTADLNVSDRIRLVATGGERLARIVDTHGKFLREETLAVSLDLGAEPLAHRSDVTLDGDMVTISLERA